MPSMSGASQRSKATDGLAAMFLDPRERHTVTQVLAERSSRLGDRPFLVGEEGELTYREFSERALTLAQGLVSLGIAPGETVLVMLPNVTNFVVLWAALARIGAVQVPVNTAYRGGILEHIISDSRARVIIADGAFLAAVAEAAARCPSLEHVVVHDAGDGDVNADLPEGLTNSRFDALACADAALPEPPAPSDLIAVMYTSGTTGPSKGAMITHAHAYVYAHNGHDRMQLDENDVYFAPLPLFHIGGQWAVVYAAMICGAAAVITRRFSVSTFWQDAVRYRATASFLLGAMANFLRAQPPGEEERASRIDRMLIVPLFPEVKAFGERFGVRVVTTYGSTEANSPMIAAFDEPDWRRCGKVKEGLFEARIVDDDDEEVPDGTVGKLVVRPCLPGLVMAGYWGHPDWTAQAWRNLWLHTGDAMYRDEEGYFYFVDRKKDAIRRRGENISSVEVENEINSHPDVIECAVFPVRSQHTEDDVMAAVVLGPGSDLGYAALIAFLEPRMADFMIPRFVEFVAELPKTPTGKIQKFELRARGRTPATWDRDGDDDGIQVNQKEKTQ